MGNVLQVIGEPVGKITDEAWLTL